MFFSGKMAAWSSVTVPLMTETGDKCACAKWVKLQSLRRACSHHMFSSCQSHVIYHCTYLIRDLLLYYDLCKVEGPLEQKVYV